MAGTVYRPLLETVPPVAVHVTEVFDVPVTLAENCLVEPFWIEADVGLIVIATDAGAVTVTVADADFVESATLVAFTVYVPAVPGATYVTLFPDPEIAPPDTDQVTAVFELLPTLAVELSHCRRRQYSRRLGVIDTERLRQSQLLPLPMLT